VNVTKVEGIHLQGSGDVVIWVAETPRDEDDLSLGPGINNSRLGISESLGRIIVRVAHTAIEKRKKEKVSVSDGAYTFGFVHGVWWEIEATYRQWW